jgi:hypothetical protein
MVWFGFIVIWTILGGFTPYLDSIHAFFGLGAGFITTPMFYAYDRWFIKKNGIQVTATVVRTNKVDVGDSYTFRPVFRYEINGESFEQESDGDIKPIFADGEEVVIICQMDKLTRFIVPCDEKRKGKYMVIFYIIGVAFIAVPLFIRSLI